MAGLSHGKIFEVTEKLIEKNGMKKTTLLDIAKALGVTHAALYKYYKNKEDLFQKLALNWLDETSKDLLSWDPSGYDDKNQALHDWLLLLAKTKRGLYNGDQKMFILYTNYIENNSVLVGDHLQKLAKKMDQILDENGEGTALLVAFSYFHNPYFASRWNQENFFELFESVFCLMKKFDSTIDKN